MCFSCLQLVVLIKFLNQVPRDGVAMPSATPPHLSVQFFRHSSLTILPSVVEPFCNLYVLLHSVYVVGHVRSVGLKRQKEFKKTGYFERTELVRSFQNISESSEQGNSACSFYQSQPVRDSHRLNVNKTGATQRCSYHSTKCQE
jgi:hypothetical protein